MQDEFLRNYREYAVEHGAQAKTGNHVATNIAYDRLLAVLKTLYEENADSEIMSLLDDENASVRLWAAAHSLELDEPLALATLNELAAAGIPIISMDARYTAQEWLKGNLRVRQSF